MYFDNIDGNDFLFLYKSGKSFKENKYYKEHGVMDHHITLIVGTTGSGKTVFANAMANRIQEIPLNCKYNLRSKKYTMIYVSEKNSDELANAFHVFRPEQMYHHNLLKEYGMEIKTKPFKAYHPFTEKIPYKKKLPPINFFGYSIKNLERVALSYLVATDSEKLIELCIDMIDKLDDDSSYFDFLWMLYKLVVESKINEFEYDENYLPIESAGDKRSLKTVNQSLKKFNSHYMLHQNKSKYILNYTTLCNDSDHIHHLTTKWINDDKVKMFAIIMFLIRIDKTIQSNNVDKALILIFEEMKILLPSGDLEPYQVVFLKLLTKLFSRLRTKAHIIGTAQSYFDINSKFTGLFDKIFLGKLNPNDRGRLIKIHGFNKNDQEKINQLNTGEFVLWESNIYSPEEKVSDKIQVYVPPFANAEEGEDFFKKYKKEFPDDMKTYNEVYKDIIQMKKQAMKKREIEMKQWIKQKKLEKQQNKIQKNKLPKDDKKDIVKKIKTEKKELIKEQVYNMKINNPNWSFRTISDKIKGVKSHNTAKSYYEEIKVKKENENKKNI